MKNKKNSNTLNAAEKIASVINNSNQTQKLAFLFGSGINHNIANFQKDQLDWKNLGKKVIHDFLVSKNKELDSKLKIKDLSKKAKESNEEIEDNKISCSFLNDVKLEIKSKTKKDNEWFWKGFNSIEERFSYGIIVMTLNYDKVISENLKWRQPINYFLENSTNYKEEILHLHGLVNEENFINEKDALLSLEGYVNNSSRVEEKFFKFLCGQVNDNLNKEKEIYFTLLIIGTSLKEEHLLKSINRFCNKIESDSSKEYHIQIFLIVRKKLDKVIFERYKEIYQKINIEVINIKSENSENGNGYQEDFKIFWKDLTYKIEKYYFDPKNSKLNDNFLYDDSVLYIILENNFKNQNNVSIDKIINFLSPNFKLKNLLINPIYKLEKNDQILKKGTLKNYILMKDNVNQFDEIPIDKIYLIKDEEFSNEETTLILERIEKKLKNRNYSLDYEIEEFISKIYKKYQRIDLDKYKYIHLFLIKKISKNELEKKLKKYVLDRTYFSKNLTEDLIYYSFVFRLFRDYFKVGNPITKIIENTLKNDEKWFKFELPENVKDIFKITQNWREYHKKIFLFYFFSIEKYKMMIFQNLDLSLNILKENLKNKNDNKLFFTLLCFVFLNSEKEKDFIEGLKLKEINKFIKLFPNLIDYFDYSNPGMIPFSKYDGTSIDKEIKLDSFKEIIKLLKKQKSFISVTEQKAISKFLNRKFNDFSEKNKNRNINQFKKINNIFKSNNIFETNDFKLKIQINTPKWQIYLKYIKNKFVEDFFNIKPPYKISQRLEYLLDEFTKDNNEEIFNEILIITKIKFYLGYYSTYFIFFNKEIQVLLKKAREKKISSKSHQLLTKIFSKKFIWLENKDYEEYLLRIKKPQKLEEILFIDSFSKKTKIWYEVNLLIDLMKKDLKAEKLLEQRIIFEYFLVILKSNIQNEKKVSQKIGYFIILINEIKNIKNERKTFWKEHLKSLVIYYELFELEKNEDQEWKKEWYKIEKFTSDIIRALLYYKVDLNNNLFKEKNKDKEIASYFEKVCRYKEKFSKIFNELLYLKKNIEHLGQKTLKILIDIFKYYEKNNEESYQYLKTNEKFICIKNKIEKYLKK